MHRDTVAEWILGQVMTDDRAAAIAGDLSESKAQAGAFRFWGAIAGIVLVSTWTWIVALALGIYLASTSVWLLNNELLGQALSGWDLGPHSLHLTPLGFKFLNELAPLSTILLLPAPYVVIRYGLKDKLTRVVLGSLFLTLGTTCFWWLPGAPVCAAAGVACIVVCLWTRARRRALGIAVSAVAAGLLWSPVAVWLVSLVHHPLFGCELQGCVEQTPALAVSQAFLAVPVVLVCTFMHKRLIKDDAPESEETPALA